MLAHIVLFEPKPGISEGQKRLFAQLFQDLSRAVSSVRRANVGRSIDLNTGYAREFGEKTYRYAAVVEFDDSEGLVEYLTHPIHQKLGKMFWDICDRTTIIETKMADAKVSEIVDLLA